MKFGEGFRSLVGDLARPFSIYASAGSASVATVLLAYGGLRTAMAGNLDLLGAAAFIGAVWAGVGALYWGKAWEREKEAKHNATIEVAKATTASVPPAGSATVTTADTSVTVQSKAEDEGVLPPDQRVRL